MNEERNYLMISPELLARMFSMSAFITPHGKRIDLSNNECFRDDDLSIEECSYQPFSGEFKIVFNQAVTEPIFTLPDGRKKGIED